MAIETFDFLISNLAEHGGLLLPTDKVRVIGKNATSSVSIDAPGTCDDLPGWSPGTSRGANVIVIPDHNDQRSPFQAVLFFNPGDSRFQSQPALKRGRAITNIQPNILPVCLNNNGIEPYNVYTAEADLD